MCGRVGYSAHSISAVSTALSPGKEVDTNKYVTDGDKKSTQLQCKDEIISERCDSPRNPKNPNNGIIKDQPNAGPGNEFHVFRRSNKRGSNADGLDCIPMIWGLLPKHGTQHHPHLLPTDPEFSVSPHYAMFNARSETVYDKVSFSSLIRNGQTCILALEGYYEWTKSQSFHEKKKQPYFICNSNKKNKQHQQQQPLLMAGLWSTVKTGKRIKRTDTGTFEEETISTFTILTTDAHPKYAWLHPRQPIMLWDTSIALEWLFRPTYETVQKLRFVPIHGSSSITTGEESREESNSKPYPSIWESSSLSVYPVSNKMNDVKYQGDDCTLEVKLEKAPTIKSFFSPGGGGRATKKAKIETPNYNEERKLAPPQNESKIVISSSSKRATPRSKEAPITEEKIKGEDDILPSNETEHNEEKECNEEKSWTCAACTYVHTGAAKFDYLTCEICLTVRR